MTTHPAPATADADLPTYAPDLPRRATGLLADFARAGALTAADVHVAQRLGALGGETDETVLLAAALVVRSTAHGSVVIDLASVADTWIVDDLESTTPHSPASPAPADLSWPGGDWVTRCAASPLVGDGRPLQLNGTRLWLTKYWQQEQQVADELLARSATTPEHLDLDLLRASLARLFGPRADPDQRTGAAVSALTQVSVLAGGPGTGKTTTVSRLLAALREQNPDCRIALAAPTGKAAARLEEAVRSSAATLDQTDQDRLGDLHAGTLHRLLGWQPGARSRFRHHHGNRLPYEIVVIDESSMVSLTLMCRLLEALRPSTRLVLVGDPDQLASVEAGAVLGDLVDRAAIGQRTPALAERLRAVLPGTNIEEHETSPGARVRDGVTTLRTNHRAEVREVAKLAELVQAGDADGAIDLLRSGAAGVQLVEIDDDARPGPAELAGVRADVLASGAALHEAATRGDAAAAVRALDAHRLLCAHRHGPRGVTHWSSLAAVWLTEQHPVIARPDGHYAGEPLIVTHNDYDIGLYNGDNGAVIEGSGSSRGSLVAAFARGGAPILVPIARIGDVRPLHALTVHRSQGSQFTRVTVVLPPAASHLGTRETIYTAVSRATHHVRLIGSTDALAAAIRRPAARATGLRERLG